MILFRLRFVVMTPIRVRSGNPNHELNDLPCFDRWFTARANKPTISRVGPRSRAKALSNLIHLFRASGCPSSGLWACLSFFTYWWLCFSPRHTMGYFNMGFVIYWRIYLNRLLKEVRATIRSFILWIPFVMWIFHHLFIMFWLAHTETIASLNWCWCNSFAVVSDHFSPQPIPHTYRLPAFFPLPANLSEELYA